MRPDTYIEINNFYTPTIYEKGAELVRMIQTILGKAGFRKGMDLYFERHDGEAATIEDFLTCFEEANGADLSHFKQWYHQSGTPELVCSLDYDKSTKVAELTVEQVVTPTSREPKKKPLHIPLKLALLGANGQELDLVLDTGKSLPGGVLHITKRKETFRFTGIPSQPVPSLLRGFSAPVNLTIDLSDRDLEFLMAHDSDLLQSLAGRQHLRDPHDAADGRCAGHGQTQRTRRRALPRRSVLPSATPSSTPPIAPSY